MKKTPMRKCTGCGEMKDKKEMIRVIRNDEGKLEGGQVDRRQDHVPDSVPGEEADRNAQEVRRLSPA